MPTTDPHATRDHPAHGTRYEGRAKARDLWLALAAMLAATFAAGLLAAWLLDAWGLHDGPFGILHAHRFGGAKSTALMGILLTVWFLSASAVPCFLGGLAGGVLAIAARFRSTALGPGICVAGVIGSGIASCIGLMACGLARSDAHTSSSSLVLEAMLHPNLRILGGWDIFAILLCGIGAAAGAGMSLLLRRPHPYDEVAGAWYGETVALPARYARPRSSKPLDVDELPLLGILRGNPEPGRVWLRVNHYPSPRASPRGSPPLELVSVDRVWLDNASSGKFRDNWKQAIPPTFIESAQFARLRSLAEADPAAAPGQESNGKPSDA